MDFRPILYVMGMLLSLLAIGMTVPMFVDLYFNHDDWKVFFFSICICAFFGGTLILSNTGSTDEHLNIRQAFVLTATGDTKVKADRVKNVVSQLKKMWFG